ncbi:MAG: hypothetical protein RIR18_190 [Pseudomonadota bacterium]|jgi:MtN3 and saliva related transmembrane protein
MEIFSTLDLVGFLAATFTTIAFIPQALKSWKTRDLSGISLPMYALFTLGVGFWLIYGILITSWPIMIGNSITFALASMVLILKIRDRH